MIDTTATLDARPNTAGEPTTATLDHVRHELTAAFGVEFAIYGGPSGYLVRAENQPTGDELYRGELARRMMDAEAAAFIDEADPLILLAIPLGWPGDGRRRVVAMSAFVTRPAAPDESLQAAARLLACDADTARQWIAAQPIWPLAALERAARMVQEKFALGEQCRQLRREVEQLSHNLTNTYEEISLLYGVTQNLRISATEEDLARLALEWLLECLPVHAIAIQYLPVTSSDDLTYRTRRESELLTGGESVISNADFTRLIAHLELVPGCGPTVVNRSTTRRNDWPLLQVRQVILVPLAEGQNLFGWLAAINHEQDGEFGTEEASLLNSVAAILGIHAANRELYRQQSEFMANVVRALTSAIDAKDPYTCGHSDRVARIAVRIARHMGCTPSMLNTLYMAGLLHDIGKIGIDDQVLRKPGRLTEAEFEHIKLHPELGYRILSDLRQLSDVLPVVLHHHEQWDGGGYPARLKGEETPLLARITAVADAFDAMTSDRHYRKGLPLEKVDEIFRQGAGQQWDPRVVEAYFACRDDIVEISRRERENLSLDVEQWRD